MAESASLYGLLAEFETAEDVTEAARAARRAGFQRLEAFTPFPVEELQDVLGLKEGPIGPIFFLGAVGGLAFALAIMWYVNIDYPINVGGRPLFAWPAFLVVGVELLILGAVLTGVVAMLYLNGLPRLHHPVFEAPRFGFASDDRFFLCLLVEDERRWEEKARAFLLGLQPRSLEAVRA